jgi:hypothetical protein
MSDIRVHIHTQDGKTLNVETPSNMNTKEFLDQLLEGRPPADGTPLSSDSWSLADQATGQPLQMDRTLEGNGVLSGNHLLLRLRSDFAICRHCAFKNALESRFCRQCGKSLVSRGVVLHLHRKDGSTQRVEVPDESITAVAFIAEELMKAANLPAERAKVDAANWVLHDKDLARNLDPKKSLADNGVQNEHHLYLTSLLPELPQRLDKNEPPVPPTPPDKKGAPPSPRPAWLHKVGTIIAICLAALAVLGIGGYLIHRFAGGHAEGQGKTASGGQRPQEVPAHPKPGPGVGSPPGTDTTISPATVTLEASQSQQFAVTLPPELGSAVTWTLSPNEGSISASGVYTAPTSMAAPEIVMVTATSTTNSAYFANASINLNPSSGPPSPGDSSPPGDSSSSGNSSSSGDSSGSSSTTRITPSAAALDASGTRRFAVNPNPGVPVQWILSPRIGSISPDGLYTAPPLVKAQRSITVSTNLPNSSNATVTLQPVAIVATCGSGMNGTSICTATVTHAANTAVAWSVDPPKGSITPQGVYSSVHLKVPYDVTITARSIADPAKYYQVPIHYSPPVSYVRVAINPFNPVVIDSRAQVFSATVTGALDTSVTWSADGIGKINPNGLYVPPPGNVSPGSYTIHVTATSNADPLQQAQGSFTWVHSAYSGPQQGRLAWSGNLGNHQILTINGSHASSGTVISGALPGAPVTIQLITPQCTVISPPSKSNGWRTVTIQAGTHLHSITIDWRVIPQ